MSVGIDLESDDSHDSSSVSVSDGDDAMESIEKLTQEQVVGEKLTKEQVERLTKAQVVGEKLTMEQVVGEREVDDNECIWYYLDSTEDTEQGCLSTATMRKWYKQGIIREDTMMRRGDWVSQCRLPP